MFWIFSFSSVVVISLAQHAGSQYGDGGNILKCNGVKMIKAGDC